jgi:hypothetical protein
MDLMLENLRGCFEAFIPKQDWMAGLETAVNNEAVNGHMSNSLRHKTMSLN